MMLRAGNAGSNTAADHISVTTDALAALPGVSLSRPGKKILIRTDGAGGTKEFLGWLARRGVQYSIGFTLPAGMPQLYQLIPAMAWQAALDGDGQVRDGAGLVEITDLLPRTGLTGYPDGMRVIVRRERPHPGAQLHFEDVDGYRLTGFATNTTRGQLADLELRHRRRARCEDRIRNAKDSGLRGLPLQGFDQNRIWCALVMLAADVTAWAQILALTGTNARKWETQTAPPAPVCDPRDPGPHRATDPAPRQGDRAVGGPGHHGLDPTRPARRPNLTTTRPNTDDQHHPRDVDRDAHRERHPAALSHPLCTMTGRAGHLPGHNVTPTPHARSGLVHPPPSSGRTAFRRALHASLAPRPRRLPGRSRPLHHPRYRVCTPVAVTKGDAEFPATDPRSARLSDENRSY